MAALAVVLLAQCRQGDHVVVSDQLYGRSHTLWVDEAARLGIAATVVDTTDLKRPPRAAPTARNLLLVETISNPLLRVADLPRLAEWLTPRGAKLVVDNTFASPALCRPLEFGADLVVESLTKIMNGHSDVLLGLLCGRRATPGSECREFFRHLGLHRRAVRMLAGGTRHRHAALRMERAAANALAAAQFLPSGRKSKPSIIRVCRSHPDHALAARQLGGRYGWMVAFTLRATRHRLPLHRRRPRHPVLSLARRTLDDANAPRLDKPPAVAANPAGKTRNHRWHDSSLGRDRIAGVRDRRAGRGASQEQ